MIEYLIVIGVIVFIAIVALLFLKFQHPPKRDNPLIVEENIHEARQPLFVFAGGKRVATSKEEGESHGLPYVGRAFYRKKYHDDLHFKINDILSNAVVELNPVRHNSNLVIPEGMDLSGGQVIYFCNIDAANRVCEWNFTTAQRYMQQMSDITLATIESRVQEKVEKDLEKKMTRVVLPEGISLGGDSSEITPAKRGV